jgi:DUF4097 and DUF4098 domain-containing protein YvlB
MLVASSNIDGGHKLKRFFQLVTALLLAAPLLVAQDTNIHREGDAWAREITGSLGAAKNIRIKVDVGNVRVEGGSQDISYVIHNRAYTDSENRARREFDAYKISTYVRGDTAWVVAEWEGGSPHKFSADFVIRVPRATEAVKLETEGGNISTTAIAGRVEAESGGGSIHLDDIGGAVTAETGGGSIDAGNTGGDLRLHTGGGSIRIDSAKGKIIAESGGGSVMVTSGMQGASLETGGGSIQVEKCNGKVKASTGGGSIDLGDIGGPADIDTGGGSIRLNSAKGFVRANTGGGTIELNGVPSAHAETGAGGIIVKFISSNGERNDSILETGAGDITVYLPSDLHISVRAAIEAANGHNIRSDFPDIHVSSEGGDWGPKTVTAEGNLNGGGPVLKVRTTTGDIRFRLSH